MKSPLDQLAEWDKDGSAYTVTVRTPTQLIPDAAVLGYGPEWIWIQAGDGMPEWLNLRHVEALELNPV